MTDTPICHRTIGEGGAKVSADYEHRHAFFCIGSACSLWVPRMFGEGQVGPCIPGKDDLIAHPEGWYKTAEHDTGYGWCASNMQRPPWPDPAQSAVGTDPVPSEPSIMDEPAWQALSPLSTRTTNALRDRLPYTLWGDGCGARDVTVRELCELTAPLLLKMRNFARRSLKEVEVALKEHGLRLSTYDEWEARL